MIDRARKPARDLSTCTYREFTATHRRRVFARREEFNLSLDDFLEELDSMNRNALDLVIWERGRLVAAIVHDAEGREDVRRFDTPDPGDEGEGT